jgi:PAS domain S-box-containing protein
MTHCREIAMRDQYHSAAVVPLRLNAKVIGLLYLIAADSDFFMLMEEQQLLEEMGMDISYALEGIEVERQRKQARVELIESEERFQKAFYSGPVGLAITRGSDGVYIDANPAFSKIVGFRQEELVGETSLNLNITTPVQRQEYTHLMKEQGFIRNQEMRLRSKSGEIRVVLGSMEVIELNNEICVLSTAIDITDRKAAEQNLRESEERFRQLADNIEEVFWIFDPVAQKEVYISPAFEKIWMRPVKTLVDNADLFFEFILPEDRAHVRAVTSRQMLGEKTEVQYRISRPDGSIRWIWDRGFPVFDENGKISRIVAIVSDISEQKQAELDLIELNQTLENRVKERTAEVMDLYENAPAGYHSIDTNGLIVRMNQTELNWLGYTREEVVGVKSITDLYTPESKKIWLLSSFKELPKSW